MTFELLPPKTPMTMQLWAQVMQKRRMGLPLAVARACDGS
jgi:hypothetical protein